MVERAGGARRPESWRCSRDEVHRLDAAACAQHGFSRGREAAAEQEPELLRYGPAYVLYALMDAVVDRYFPVIEAFTDENRAIP